MSDNQGSKGVGGLDIDPMLKLKMFPNAEKLTTVELKDQIKELQKKLVTRRGRPGSHKSRPLVQTLPSAVGGTGTRKTGRSQPRQSQKGGGQKIKRPLAVGHGNAPARSSGLIPSKQEKTSSGSDARSAVSHQQPAGPSRVSASGRHDHRQPQLVDKTLPLTSAASSTRTDIPAILRENRDNAAAAQLSRKSHPLPVRRAARTSQQHTEHAVVLEAVEQQQAAVKLNRKRRRNLAAGQGDFAGFEPDAVEAVLVAERAESQRVTRSQRLSGSPSRAAPVSHSTDHRLTQEESDEQSAVPETPPGAGDETFSAQHPGTASPSAVPVARALPETVPCIAQPMLLDAHHSPVPTPDPSIARPILPTQWPSLSGEGPAMAERGSFRCSADGIALLAMHSDGDDVAVAVAALHVVTVHFWAGQARTVCSTTNVVSATESAHILTLDFMGGGLLVVGGRFADSDVLCRVFRVDCRQNTAVIRPYTDLRICSVGSLYCTAVVEATLFTCSWSDGGMVVTVAAWDIPLPGSKEPTCPKWKGEPRMILPEYHSGSALVALRPARALPVSKASSAIVGANSHRAVVWDYNTRVQLATISLELGDIVAFPPERRSINCIDVLHVVDLGGTADMIVMTMHLQQWDEDDGDHGVSAARSSCPRVLLRWTHDESQAGPVDGDTACVLDDVDLLLDVDEVPRPLNDIATRRVMCAAAFGDYYAVGDNLGRVVILDQFSGPVQCASAVPIAVIGPQRQSRGSIEDGRPSHAIASAITVEHHTRALCVAFGDMVHLLR
eukprot:m.74299 g.74299  ORF g.74299 m.74299 type:complete len:781 (+) comp18888_c0_seq1:37-2379(+)